MRVWPAVRKGAKRVLYNTVFTRTDDQRFIISAETMAQYYIRAAVHMGRPMVSINDTARCCGLKETSKMAERCSCDKVKLQSRGKGARRVTMWYFGLEDAVEFVQARLLPDDFFYGWFINRLVPELKTKDLSFTSVKPAGAGDVPPVQPPPKAPAATRQGDGLDSFVAQIDQMIVELVTMKHEISCMRT